MGSRGAGEPGSQCLFIELLSAQEADQREPTEGSSAETPGQRQVPWHIGLSRTLAETSASITASRGTFEMSTSLPSLPEKFSSALQLGTLLDLLQIESMKIEEESEVRQLLTPGLPCRVGPWSR